MGGRGQQQQQQQQTSRCHGSGRGEERIAEAPEGAIGRLPATGTGGDAERRRGKQREAMGSSDQMGGVTQVTPGKPGTPPWEGATVEGREGKSCQMSYREWQQRTWSLLPLQF